MSKIRLALLLALLTVVWMWLAGVAVAQTCPSAISTSPDATDTGSGPNYNFYVDGVAIPNGGTAGIHVITPTLSASPIGWVDVRPGYNGCFAGWTYFIVTEWKLTRLRDGFTETRTTRQGPHQSTGCTYSYSCFFNLGLTPWQLQLSLGEWQFQSLVHAEVTSIEGVSYFSQTYTGSIIIEISAR